MTTLRQAAQQALEAMDALHRTGDTQVFDLCHKETTESLRAALAEPVQEPEGSVCARCGGLVFDPVIAPPQRKPLTDEEIDWMTRGNNYPGTVPGARRFARAVEAAHGIKEKA